MFNTPLLRKLQLTTLIAAAALIALMFVNWGGGGVGTTSAEEADATTLRIAAQRLEDGRTAFALQVREDDAWGERIEPTANILRRVEDARVGRWANSSLLELGSGHTVRISAKRLASDQIEFALQEIVDGEPAERILPTRNKFPVNPTVGQWLYSSPIELAAIDTGPPPPTHIALVNYSGQHAANVRYNSSLNEDGSVTSNVYTNSEEGGDFGAEGFGASFALWCWSSQNLGILLDGLAPQDAESLPVTLTIDGAAQPTADWKVGHHYRDDMVTHSWLELRDDAARTLFEQLQSASQLSAQIDGVSGTHTWNIADTFTTPIQGNLAECGNYVEGQVQEPPPPTYVPVLTDKGRDGNVRYDANLTDDGRINTIIDTHGENTAMYLRLACWGEHLNVVIDKLPPLATDQVEVLWSVDDDETISEIWQVETIEGSHSYINAPFAPGMLRTLRDSSSFTFWVNAAGIRSVTLDLSNTFDTPVQGNIDNCGDYVEGETREIEHDYVPVVNLGGHSGNASYSAQEHDGRIHSSVTTRSTTTDASAPALELAMACGTELGINIRSLPLIEGDRFPLTIRIDDGPPITMDWHFHGTEQFTAAWPPQTPHDSYSLAQMLRGAKTLTVESPDHWDGPVTFDLDGFFDTPVQENLDNCGKYKAGETREIEYDYVPWIGNERVSASLQYRAFVTGDGVNTDIYTRCPHAGRGRRQAQIPRLLLSQGTSLNMQVLGFPMGEQRPVEVTITFDDGTTHVSSWRVSDWNGNGVQTHLPPNLMARLAASQTATFTIEGVEFSPMTFDLTGMSSCPSSSTTSSTAAWPSATRAASSTAGVAGREWQHRSARAAKADRLVQPAQRHRSSVRVRAAVPLGQRQVPHVPASPVWSERRRAIGVR